MLHDIKLVSESLRQYQQSVRLDETAFGQIWPGTQATGRSSWPPVYESNINIHDRELRSKGSRQDAIVIESSDEENQDEFFDVTEDFDKEDTSPQEQTQKEEILPGYFKLPSRPTATRNITLDALDPRTDHFANLVQTIPAVSPLKLDVRSTTTNPSVNYFTNANFPSPSGAPPRVVYITNAKQLDSMLRQLKPPIIGFDMEWRSFGPLNVSLVQISDASTILLIHLSLMNCFPDSLKKIIEDPNWIKCGVNIMGADMSRLRRLFHIRARGVCELSYFARLVDRKHWGPKNNLIKLALLSETYLGKNLRKGDVRCSDWSKLLTGEQRQYAADDAYSGYLIFMELERRRQNTPGFSEVWPRIGIVPEHTTIKATSGYSRYPPGGECTASHQRRYHSTTTHREVNRKLVRENTGSSSGSGSSLGSTYEALMSITVSNAPQSRKSKNAPKPRTRNCKAPCVAIPLPHEIPKKARIQGNTHQGQEEDEEDDPFLTADTFTRKVGRKAAPQTAPKRVRVNRF